MLADVAGDAGIDDSQRDAMLTSQHIDRGSAAEVIQQHLRRHRLRISAHAIGGDAMIASEYKHLRRMEYRRFGIERLADANREGFQCAERTLRLGARVQSALQGGVGYHRSIETVSTGNGRERQIG